MKTLIRVLALALVITLMLPASAVKAADYYVVVGAFYMESNARTFTNAVRGFFKEASYSYNENKKLYYVHVMKTSRKDEARTWTLYLKYEKGIKDAWVLTEPEVESQTFTAVDPKHREPRYEAEMKFEAANLSSFSPQGDTHHRSKTVSDIAQPESAWAISHDFGFIGGIKNIESFKTNFPGSSTNLFTFIVEDSHGRVIPSEVMLVNFQKARKIASFLSGETVAVKGTRPEQMVTFVCDVLGYSQETRMFNIDHLSRGKHIIQNDKGIWEIRIKLNKMEVNDIAFMNKTLFYEDAAILKPTSQAEIDELVVLMKNNPAYRIVLHSHCNSGSARKIKLPAQENSYFAIDETIEKRGSDKLLTKKRAQLVRSYLVNHGIEKKRLDMVAWGSMEMIEKPTSEDAHINDRIEVELIAE